MKANWAYDKGGLRECHSTTTRDAADLGSLLRKLHDRAEPVVVTIYPEIPTDPDELAPGLQIGLGHPTHAFVAYIADDGYYLAASDVRPPAGGISFDLGGVPTEYPAEHLRLRPEAAIAAAVTYLRTGGEPPTLPTCGHEQTAPEGEPSMSNQQQCQVVTATDSRTVAEALADSAVAARLAASAQVAGPVRSTYWWQGEVVAAEEWRVTFRTMVTRYAELEEHIRARHNYEVPGIVCVPIVAGYPPYLEWMAAETRER